jgi:beta-glucosidase
MLVKFLSIVVVSVGAVSLRAAEIHAPYKDSRLSVEDRVGDLLGRMTVDEKVHQLLQASWTDMQLSEDSALLAEKLKGFSYGVLDLHFGSSCQAYAGRIRAAQQYVRRKTRLGIPFLPYNETLHGVLSEGATIFPQTIAQGATWNPALIKEMAAAIAKEGSSIGLVQSLSPMLELARDPRWGRVEECFGECPYLVSRMVVAYIQGMQGDDARRTLASDKLLCMSKVMAGYCAPAGGINIAPASLGERELRSVYLMPHEAAVKEAHVWSVMPSYNAIDGVPSHKNHWLLTKVLRDEWGFQGYVFSDGNGVLMLHRLHGVSTGPEESAALALRAGVDVEEPETDCYRLLPELIHKGIVEEQELDQAVARVLRAKFVAGLFDARPDPVPPAELAKHIHTKEHAALARRMAEESVILLKNQDHLLPLDASKIKSIAVIGPNADQVQFGDYCWTKSNRHGVSVLQGLRELVGDKVRLNYAKGCDLVGLSKDGFAAAQEAARNSDVALVVIGDTSMILSGVGWEDPKLPLNGTVGEGFDVTDPVPPGVQMELVKAVQAAGKPTIVVMLHGRPYSVPWMKEHIPAILGAFYPGEEQGRAIADILFGRVNPSGRLPVSVAQSAGHIPTVYDYLPSQRGFYRQPGTPEKPGRDYVYSSPDPLWSFGYGLSYTTFNYSDLRIDTPTVSTDGTLLLTFTVANTGPREGKEVVQVYFHDEIGSVDTPLKRLIRFQKVHLRAGERRHCEFVIPAREFALWNVDMKRVVEPGAFEIMVGPAAEDLKLRGKFAIR